MRAAGSAKGETREGGFGHRNTGGRMRRYKVTILLPYELDRAPGQRYRWEQWRPQLEAHGLEVDLLCFSPPALGDARRHGRPLLATGLFVARYPFWLPRALSAARRSDLVVVHRNAALTGPPVAETVTLALGRPLVYDFDDPIYLPPEEGDNPLRRLVRCDWRAAWISARATLVGTGSPVLADWARRHNRNVALWPSTVNTDLYHLRPEEAAGAVPVIGWTGSPSTAIYMRELLPTLAELQRETAFDVRVIGAEIDLAGHGVRGRCVPWRAETEVPDTSGIDIGLMPLPDTPWARGKCALKAIQYLGLGIPAVVSDVGVNRDVVRHGEHGYVVPPGGDWKAPLRTLLADPALRRQMGLRGREHVVANYSAAAVGARVARDLRKLLDAIPEPDEEARRDAGAPAPGKTAAPPQDPGTA